MVRVEGGLTWLDDPAGHGTAFVRAVRSFHLSQLHGCLKGREVHRLEDIFKGHDGTQVRKEVTEEVEKISRSTKKTVAWV